MNYAKTILALASLGIQLVHCYDTFDLVKIICHFYASYGEIDVITDDLSKSSQIKLLWVLRGIGMIHNDRKSMDHS